MFSFRQSKKHLQLTGLSQFLFFLPKGEKMLSTVCMHGKIRFTKCFSTPQMHGGFLTEKRFSACIKEQMHKFQTKTSSWSETFVCNFSNKASWFFKLPFPVLTNYTTLTGVWNEVKSIQIFISWQIFGWRLCSCSNVQPWALTSGPEQPCSGTSPSLPCLQPVHLFFSVCKQYTGSAAL